MNKRPVFASNLDRLLSRFLDGLIESGWLVVPPSEPGVLENYIEGFIVRESLAESSRLADSISFARACPCFHTVPCDPRCSCIHPHSSRGCARCCAYGSAEQQRLRAEHLAELIEGFQANPEERE